jgi:GNAT superfamily N-acetyltransferase
MVEGPDVALRPAQASDRPFIEAVYFGTNRWLIEKLFGWRGDEYEREKFSKNVDLALTSIVLIDGRDAGWLMVVRTTECITLNQIYLDTPWQSKGVGSLLIKQLIEEARTRGVPLRLSTAKINPARRLYDRLGFVEVDESERKVYFEIR